MSESESDSVPVPLIQPEKEISSKEELLELAPEEARPWMSLIFLAWSQEIKRDWSENGEVK